MQYVALSAQHHSKRLEVSMRLQSLFAVIATLGLTGSALAVPFDGSTGTTATVTVNSDGSGDYISLKAASQAFNAVTTINRPWLLLVDSDLAETSRVAFGTNVTAGAGLTIKPSAGKTPTISLANATPGNTNSYYGALVIGTNDSGISDIAGATGDPTAASIFETNNAFTIDGSNTEGGTTRDLTIRSTADLSGNMIRVVGSTNGFVVKNANLLMRKPSGSAVALAFGAGKIAGFGTQGGDYKSDYAVVDNCFIEAKATTNGAAGLGIQYSISAFGTLSAPKHFEGHVVRNCVFDVRHRGISSLYQVNSLYDGNEFHVRNNATGNNSGAIQILAQNGDYPSSYTMTISNNKILDLQTSNTNVGDYGINGIGLTVGLNATYKVNNNVITGIRNGGSSAVDQISVGIWATGSTSVYQIEHNSINMDPQVAISGASRNRAAGIVINSGPHPTASYVKNNIVRYAVGKGAPVVVYASSAGASPIATANVAGNNLVQTVTGDPASPLAYIGTALVSTTPYADQAALSTAGYNNNGGQSVDPAATVPAWASDLSFSAEPPTLGKVASSSVLTDINREARPATNAYPGAYRIAAGSSVNDWSVY